MTAEEYRVKVAMLNLPSKQIAALCGVGSPTLSRYKNGHANIPRYVESLINMLIVLKDAGYDPKSIIKRV